MFFHPLVVLACFQGMPKGFEFFFPTGIHTEVLFHSFPFLGNLVMVFVGVHFFCKFFRVSGVDQIQQCIHFTLAGGPAFVQFGHFLFVGGVLVILFLQRFPLQASAVVFFVNVGYAVGIDGIGKFRGCDDGLGPFSEGVQFGIDLFQPKVHDFPFPFGRVNFLPLFLESRQVFRSRPGKAVFRKPVIPGFFGLIPFFCKDAAFFFPVFMLLFLFPNGFLFPGNGLSFGLILVEAGSFLLHEIVEGLEFIHCFRRLAGEFFADLLAGCFQFVFPGSQFFQSISFFMDHMAVENVEKDGQDGSTGRTVHSSHSGSGGVEGGNACGRCQKEHKAHPQPGRIFLIFSAADIIYFGLDVRFLVEHLFQFSGHGFDFLPVRLRFFLFWKDQVAREFFHFRFPLLPEMEFIVPDAQAAGKAASFFPVHAGAGFVQT